MSDFEGAVNFVIRNEGGLNQHKLDLGGTTHHGISQRYLKSLEPEKLKSYGVLGDPNDSQTIIDLTIDQAKTIYFNEFWQHAPFNKILNQAHTNYIFDMAVTIGIAPAVKCVQRACWAVMREWHLLKDDGILGEKTLAAIAQCGFLLMPALRTERGAYYRMVIATHPEQKEFLNGWYNRTYNTQ